MKVCDIISNFFIKKEINIVFGIIGSANSKIYDSLSSHNIKIINVHHEQTAIMAAASYFRTRGKVAAALVTAGAGAANAITGILGAWADSIPVLVFTGQESSNYVKEHSCRRMYGTQGFDIVDMVSKITKYANILLNEDLIQNELELMFSKANNGRKGPVLLDIPFDIQSKETDILEWNEYIPDIINDGIRNMNELIHNSKKPVIIAGHGIKLSNSVKLFKEVLNKLQIPVLLTWSGIDILDNSHPLYFGRPGVYGQRAANFILQNSDLLIVLGSRLTLPQSGYDFKEFARNSFIVMVDIDKTEFKEFVDLCINTDCKLFLEQISNFSYLNEEWLYECNKIKNRFPIIEKNHVDNIFPNSYRIVDKISDYLKNDQIIVTDMGTALLSGHQAIKLKSENIMFSSYGLGEMGFGLPAAIGAAFGDMNREVLCLNCDGSMMMNLQELQTIIQHKLKIKIVIFNNDGYLMIKHTQKMLFKGKYNSVDSNTGIVLPDYINLANAFGYKNYRIKTWEEFDIFFPEFMSLSEPTICEIFMNPDQDFIPKVKGLLDNNNKIFAPPIEELSPLLDYDTIKEIMGTNISEKSHIISRI